MKNIYGDILIPEWWKKSLDLSTKRDNMGNPKDYKFIQVTTDSGSVFIQGDGGPTLFRKAPSDCSTYIRVFRTVSYGDIKLTDSIYYEEEDGSLTQYTVARLQWVD